MSTLEESAKAFVARYDTHIQTGKALIDARPEDLDAQLTKFSTGMASYFLPKPVVFGLGAPAQWESHEQGAQLLKTIVGRYIELGIGYDGVIKSSKCEVLYDHGGFGAVLVEMVFEITAAEKLKQEPWPMRAVFGYRKMETGEEGWEWGYMDDEAAQLKKRFPNFYDVMGPPPQ